MPFTTRDGARLYWKLDGSAGKPPLVLLHSIGTDMSLWDQVVPLLERDFRTLRIDTRGHGASDALGGDYTMAMLAADTLAILDDAGIGEAAMVGVSLGGMIAMELALVAPDRVSALALVCTSAEMDRGAWEERIAKVRADGMAMIAGLAMGRFLDPGFARRHPAVAETLRRELLAMNPAGYAGAGAAIRDMNLIGRIASIETPVLVVSGARDISTPAAEHGARIAAAIDGATSVELDCAHLAPVEAPRALAAALRDFLLADPDARAAARRLYEAGLINRRRVLGDEWVERALTNRTAFTADFQEMITRTAWQEIWGRPYLDDRTRRLLVLAITAALGRWEEFRLHVRAGLTQACLGDDDVKEMLMLLAVYAGVPAANTGFTEAREAMADMGGAS